MNERLYSVVGSLIIILAIVFGIWMYVDGNKIKEILASYPAVDIQSNQALNSEVTSWMITAAKLRKVSPELAAEQDQDGMTRLHWAASNGDAGIVRLLLAQKPAINRQANNGMTALHCAAAGRQLVVTKILLKHGADPEIQDSGGHLAVYYAEQNGDNDIADLLHAKTGE